MTLGAPRLAADGALRVDYATQAAGSGRWRVDAGTLAPLALLPPAPAALPEELLRPSAPGLEVQTVTARAGGRRYVLRWETLPRNRDQPRDEAPPSAELRLFELPDTETGTAARIGS